MPSLGTVVTKQSGTNNIKHTITVTKVVHVPNSALRSSSASSTSIAASASTVVPSTRSDQVRFIDNYQMKTSVSEGQNKQYNTFHLMLNVCSVNICSVLFFFPPQADSVERPPSDQQCEELWSEGWEPDGAHEAKAPTKHHYTGSNSHWDRSFLLFFEYRCIDSCILCLSSQISEGPVLKHQVCNPMKNSSVIFLSFKRPQC